MKITVSDQEFDILQEIKTEKNSVTTTYKVKIFDRIRDLKVRYNIELAKDLEAVFGIDAEQELDRVVREEISKEIYVILNGNRETE